MATLEELVVQIKVDLGDLKARMAEAQAAIKGVGEEHIDMEKKGSSSLKNLISPWQAAGAAMAAAGAAIAAGVGIAAKSYMDFEQTSVNAASVTGLTGQAYQDALANIKAVSQELGSSTTFSASEAANAMYDLASAGFDVSTMAKSDLQPILDIAAGTQSDLTFTTKTVTDAISQFGLTTADSGRIADVYATAIGESKATMESLSSAMVYAGPVSEGLGRSLEETTAVIARLNDAGFTGEQAGTAFRSSMLSLVDPSKEAIGALGSLGIEIEDINPTTHTYTEILATLSEHGMSVADATKIFGKESAAAMTALVGQTFAVEDLTTSLQDCKGAAEDLASKQRDTLAGSWDELKGSIEGIVLSLGEKLAPTLRSTAEFLSELTPHIQKVIDGMGEWGQGEVFQAIRSQVEGIVNVFKDWGNNGGLDKINGFITQLKTNWKDAFGGALQAVKDFVGSGGLERMAQAILNSVSAFMKFYNILSDTGVFKRYGAVIEGVVRTLLWMVDTGSKINIWLTSLYHSFNNAYQQINSGTQGLRATVSSAFEAIRNVISTVINAIRTVVTTGWNGIRTVVTSAGTAIQSAITGSWNNIRNAISTAMAAIRAVITTAWNTIRSAVAVAIAGIASVATTGWNNVRNAVSTAMSNIQKGLATGWNTAKTTVSNGISGIVSAVYSYGSSLYSAGASIVQSAINGIASKIQSLKDRIKELFNLSSSSSSSSGSSGGSSSGSATVRGGKTYAQDSSGSWHSTSAPGEIHDTGGIASYTGWAWLKKDELTVPPQFNWGNTVITPIVRALSNTYPPSVSSGNGTKKVIVTINNKNSDVSTLNKTIVKAAKIGAVSRIV